MWDRDKTMQMVHAFTIIINVTVQSPKSYALFNTPYAKASVLWNGVKTVFPTEWNQISSVHLVTYVPFKATLLFNQPKIIVKSEKVKWSQELWLYSNKNRPIGLSKKQICQQF